MSHELTSDDHEAFEAQVDDIRDEDLSDIVAGLDEAASFSCLGSASSFSCPGCTASTFGCGSL